MPARRRARDRRRAGRAAPRLRGGLASAPAAPALVLTGRGDGRVRPGPGGLFGLLLSLPERLFDGDVERYAAEIGLAPPLVALLRRAGSGVPAKLGRADAYHDGTAFKLLEFNLGSEVGGLDMDVFNQSLLRVPEFAGFAREHGLAHVDIAARIAAVLRDRARPALSGAAEPVIGLIEGAAASPRTDG
ncbi:hypothetical protein O1L60_35520 [Streptomyces diastatochromogenes]|nr:hypothetical protein [Streptomyces diastatochromogenes]